MPFEGGHRQWQQVKVGVNGFGRIGRNLFRAAHEAGSELEFVAVNDITDAATLAHLLKYDSDPGPLPGPRRGARRARSPSTGTRSRCSPSAIRPALPWRELGVEVVIESTGLFTKRDDAAKHLEAGAQKVIISAPATDPDVTVALGVNFDQRLRPRSAPDHLQRLLHDELPGAGGQGAARDGRDRARPDDHDPRLHRRSAAPGHAPQGPAAGPGGGDQPDPDDAPARRGRSAWCSRSSKAS